MNYNDDFLSITGDAFSEMHILIEGAIAIFENDTGPLNRLATQHKEYEARMALNDVGAALYILRRHITRLQTAVHDESERLHAARKENHDGDVPVAEVASDVPGGGSGAAAMALAVRSHHSTITGTSPALAKRLLLQAKSGASRAKPSLTDLRFRSRCRRSGFSWGGSFRFGTLEVCTGSAAGARPSCGTFIALFAGNSNG